MPILAKCPGCGLSRTVKQDYTGYPVKCPRCDSVFVLTDHYASILKRHATIQDAKLKERREEKRVKSFDLNASIPSSGEHEIKDISTRGLGFEYGMGDWVFSKGGTFSCDIFEDKKQVLKGLETQVVRVTPRTVGCVFPGIRSFQQDILKDLIQNQMDKRSMWGEAKPEYAQDKQPRVDPMKKTGSRLRLTFRGKKNEINQ